MRDLMLVSLFDGIGGFPLAFGRAGVHTVATVEIDTAAAEVAHRHFPNAVQFPDVTQVGADDFRAAGFVPDRGIVTAGWPCQDFSVAGRRAGLAGARSGLWWEVVRLLAGLRPRWFVGENVPGLLSSVCPCPGDDTCVLNGRADECGQWQPVKRGTDTSSGRFRTVGRSRQVWVAHVEHSVTGGVCFAGCMRTHGGAMGSVLGSLAELGYGVAYRVLDAQYFRVPQQRRRVVIVGHLGAPFGAAAQVLLEPESGEGDTAPRDQAGEDAAGAATHGVGEACVTTVTCKHYAHTLTAGSSPGHVNEDGTGRGTPIIAAPDVAATLTAGVSSPGVSAPGRRQEDDHNLVAFSHTAGIDPQCSNDVTPTLKAGHNAMPSVHAQTVVRRLTELECERLQGYPDEWTAGQYGTTRYKELGNSVAVPMFEWVARRLVSADVEAAA